MSKEPTKKKHQLTLTNNAKPEEEVCSICANNFELFSIGPCNHSICHVCSLRLRTLYKSNSCPLCKTDLPIIVFSTTHESFESFHLKQMDRDVGLLKGCYYASDAVKETIKHTIALKCPTCKLEHDNWKELKSHAKQAHLKYLCELCTKFGHSFTWESKLYSMTELKKHQANGDPKTSFKGHPECGFCIQRFYSNDELYEHCNKQHESCFLCIRVHNIQNQYFKSYTELEHHFETEHLMCDEPECRERKFVVFSSVIDLEAHRLEKHPSMNLGKKKGRKVDIEFQYAGSVSMRRKGTRDGEVGESSEPVESSSRDRTISSEYPAFGNARSRAPSGFGQLSTPTPSTAYAALPNSAIEPVPERTVQLTPAQQSVFGQIPDLEAQATHVLPSSEHFKKLKIMVHSYISHSLTADQLCNQYVDLVQELHPKIIFTNDSKQTRDLITAMSSLWHRISELFVDDPFATERYHILAKKQKRKGLSIQEFEEFKRATPKKEVMLNAWNGWKVKVFFVDEMEQLRREKETIKARKTGWDLESNASSTGSSSQKAKVLVIKDAPKKSKPKGTDLRHLTSKVGSKNSSSSLVDSVSSLALGPSSMSAPSSLSTPSASGGSWVTKSSTTIASNDFPSLPTASSSRPAQWNSIAQPRQEKPEVKRNKKGKQVLLHFG